MHQNEIEEKLKKECYCKVKRGKEGSYSQFKNELKIFYQFSKTYGEKEPDIQRILREAKEDFNEMKKHNCENIIQCLGYNKLFGCLYLEKCDYNFADFEYGKLREDFFFTEEVLKKIVVDVVNGLVFMHYRNISHEDIKIDNIVFNFKTTNPKKLEEYSNEELLQNFAKATYKIIDFDLSRKKTETNIYFGMGSKLKNEDMFSLGVMLLCLLMKQQTYKWEEEDWPDQKKGKTLFVILERYKLSKTFIRFLQRLLQGNPNQRITSFEAAQKIKEGLFQKKEPPYDFSKTKKKYRVKLGKLDIPEKGEFGLIIPDKTFKDFEVTELKVTSESEII